MSRYVHARIPEELVITEHDSPDSLAARHDLDCQPNLEGCVLGDGCFLNPSRFSRDLVNSVGQYPDLDYNRYVLDLLDEKELEILCSWKDAEDSRVLTIGWDEENDSSDWTTDITLELMGIIRTTQPICDPTAIVDNILMTHFCAQHQHKQEGQEEILVQGLLVQLRETHRQLFMNHQVCQQVNSYELWKMLARYIIDAKIRSLIIMLDNVDVIFSKHGPATFDEFVNNLRQFLQSLREKDVIVKLLLTTRSRTGGVEVENQSEKETYIQLEGPTHRRRSKTIG